MRIACPPLIYGCPFLGFTSSKSPLELITRRIIKELEGDENKNLEKYATTDSPEYQKMVQIIADRFGRLVEVQYAGNTHRGNRLTEMQSLYALFRRKQLFLKRYDRMK